ncbi:MAG: NAD-dependent epimerase/dehydratase family protein [Salinirussus sp.]
MRVLVTGGYGFIGSHVLCQLIDAGHDVACFDLGDPSAVSRPVADEVTDYTGDVTDPHEVYGAVIDFEPDRIIHLASLLGRESQHVPRQAVAVNLQGTLTVLEAAEDAGVERVVAASSASVYGHFPPDATRFDETSRRTPDSVYGMTKYAVEHIGPVYAERSNLDFCAIEPVHGLGPDRVRGNVEDAVVVKAAVAGEPITVPAIEYPIEIIAVQDEARAFVDATLADRTAHDVYLIGTGEQKTLTEMVDLVRDVVPGAELELGADRGDDQLVRRPPSDTSRIRDDLGWAPEYTVREAVEAYVEWLREHPDDWSIDPNDLPWGPD